MKTKFYSTIENHKEIVEPVVEAILNSRSGNDAMYKVLDELKDMYRQFLGNVTLRKTDDGRVHYYLTNTIWTNGKIKHTNNEIGYYWYE